MVKEFWNSIRFWQSYHYQLDGPLLGTQCRWNSTGCHRRLCLRLLWHLTFWPNQYVSCAGTYVTQFWWKYLRRYCIHTVFRAVVTLIFDLWSQKLISTSTNPNTSVTKIGWNFLHWFVRYGAHKVFGSLPAVTWPWRLTVWPNKYVPGPDTHIT